MHCIEPRTGHPDERASEAHLQRRLLLWGGLAGGAWLAAGCAARAPAPPPAKAPAPAAPAPRPAPAPAPIAARGPRTLEELRVHVARRLVAAHPDTSYMGKPPERLLAIPVLEIELNADGSVRRIEVLRKPSTGNESIKLATDAIYRAAPYGDVSHLPRPWKVVETFLFDDNLRFKPRTLDAP